MFVRECVGVFYGSVCVCGRGSICFSVSRWPKDRCGSPTFQETECQRPSVLYLMCVRVCVCLSCRVQEIESSETK